jgi:LPS sulfotransferase NodH
MLTRRISRLPAFLATRAVDAGWARGTSSYARFVVLGWYRTGSNLLLSLLNSDPTVVAYSEVFSPRGLFWGNHTYAPRDPSAAYEALRTSDARSFLERAVFRRYPTRVRAVGFKLFYPQLVVKPVPGLAETLTRMDDLRIVHLRRCNLLRVLVSNRIAKRTGQMAATSETDAAAALERAGTLRLEPDDCAEYFRLLEERSAACESLFSESEVLSLTYEDLADRRDEQIQRVRRFLDLPPATAETPLVRQNQRPLRDIVENLDELREAFEGTPWAAFVDG